MQIKSPTKTFGKQLTVLNQMVACLPLVHLKIFNLRARRGGDVHFLIARLYNCVQKEWADSW